MEVGARMVQHRICFIGGDGVGPEVVAHARRVLDALGVNYTGTEARAGYACYQECGSALPDATVQAARASIAALRERFKEEVREGVALIGALIADWEREQIPPGALSEDRAMQEKRRREIERLKIKIEESGVGNGDAVVREFTQTKERDEFLARELADLERSAGSLKDIIAELEKTIDEHFTAGL